MFIDKPDPDFSQDVQENIKNIANWSYYDNWQAKDRAHSRILDGKIAVDIAHEQFYVNENDLGYGAKIYNATVLLLELREKDGKMFTVEEGTLFHGDLSKRRIKKLARLVRQSRGRYHIRIRYENGDLAYNMTNKRKADRPGDRNRW